ncbi:signal recognition particle-docking protein FtsY [Streptococcus azizii]|uniref:Signal recognition particle receptor FtsY n=1 Tax=Streptococcus azizii TaxID=1579424 RepID=A0AB36JSA1_9STRE|nr:MULTISPECIES: signal recognition particle-docking protein FtsY [Streptococcus]MBF0775915.1 signal recognition particle-docking protein FtsY [Streptococcus sp. 19428wD3_AN2]ONK27495.1 signal recognition particle-docking protein FtsY [Streptococcus azizii]ONK28732.1 signal recognition particle-docking protein FtsY [Streptococcus azizii]ONK29428.1 signal recognition particle-docking protein FtsY [Streptococcus azizii]TFU83962.1 signal recognition particle-docking protein FtsY [Streptococcus sp
MGLFDRLFGRKEKEKEPILEDQPKEPAVEMQDSGAEEEVVDSAPFNDVGEESYDQKVPTSEKVDEAVEAPTWSETMQENQQELDIDAAREATASQGKDEQVDEVGALQATSESEEEKYQRTLKKTRTGFGARLNEFFANFRSVDEDFFEELEELLITSDVGVQVAANLTEELRYEARLENAKKPEVLRRLIIEKLVEIYEKDGQFSEQIAFQDGLTVMLFVGVNGVGKTTSIGKLAYRYKQAGKKIMLVAADTFRAGAVAQLVEWGRRVDVPVVTGPEKSDPASVVFDGMEKAVAEQVDVLMIDTAGRLQNKDNLMAELEKIGRIIKRTLPDAPHETLLALDASTGQNALVQAKEFSKITPLTGLVLTKLDGTARGGVVLAIRQELDIPVKLIGFGEQIDDIGEFNSESFMRSLLEGLV